MQKSLVSIVTPMYNAEKFIAQTIASVQAQTWTEWEMLIVDDVSTDKSVSIVQKAAANDPRIRLIRQSVNVGPAAARNRAVENARGKYLAFLDSDDLWEKQKLERQINFMKEKKVGFCYTACHVIDEKNQIAGKDRRVPEKINYKGLLHGNVIPCLTVVLDREKTMGVHMPNIPHEDYAAWLDILKQGVEAYGINECLASYRVNVNSISANKLKAAGWTFQIYWKQQKLGLLKSCFYFLCYAYFAVKKRN